jgi:bifunctional oligoribonuclease and PAP phosphatase NrnA
MPSVPGLDQAASALEGADSVALACHVNPDGDALGALLGLSLALNQLGKETVASWGDSPVKVPLAYSFLPGADTLVQPEAVPVLDVFVALDCGAADRLGTLEAVARSTPVLINIDHHPGNDNFGHHNIVVTAASSTSELVAGLLRTMGASIDRDVATCLYTGIVTDTGRFSYRNTTPPTLRLAADLLEVGVDAPAIAQEVFEAAPFGYLKLAGRVLDRAALVSDAGLIYSWIERKDLDTSGLTLEDTGDLIELIRATRDAEVAALLKEQDDGTWRVSVRSRGRSIGEIARQRGGGGHDLAAGYTVKDRETAIEDLQQALR